MYLKAWVYVFVIDIVSVNSAILKSVLMYVAVLSTSLDSLQCAFHMSVYFVVNPLKYCTKFCTVFLIFA